MRPLPPGASPSPGGPAGEHFGLTGLLFNASLIAALLSCAVAQLAKPLVHWKQSGGGSIDWQLAVSPGGMPSSHTASVVGLTTALGLSEGTSSTLFALAVVLSLVVAYDATGVRLHAGRHAAALNTIIGQLPREHPAADVQQLQETLGHTPPQVAAGAAVGVLTAALFIGALRLVAG